MNFCAKVKSPSNIALIKYWGKESEEQQWPANDSLSMTLKKAVTITTATPSPNSTQEIYIESNNGNAWQTQAQAKALRFINILSSQLNFKEPLLIKSENTFPANCGIASSASSFCSLTIAAIACWTRSKSFQELENQGFSKKRMALLSRMGSGSSCRSFFDGFTLWQKGESPDEQDVKTVFPNHHWSLCDIIAIINDRPKITSSTEGHRTAWQSPLFQTRLAVIPERLKDLTDAIKQKDFNHFGSLIETEAIELHMVMMTANPALKYLTDKTWQLLRAIRLSRQKNELSAYFTLDAGANVHLICEQSEVEKVTRLLKVQFAEVQLLIDEIGHGPVLEATEYY